MTWCTLAPFQQNFKQFLSTGAELLHNEAHCTSFTNHNLYFQMSQPTAADVNLCHRAGLNRGVPMGRSTQIMGGTGGSFWRGLNSEAVTFPTRLAGQPSPMYKSNGAKSKMATPLFLYPAI